jgi:hypothetical protein
LRDITVASQIGHHHRGSEGSGNSLFLLRQAKETHGDDRYYGVVLLSVDFFDAFKLAIIES